MGRGKRIIDERLAAQACAQLEGLKNPQLSVRLLAVARSWEMEIGEVAAFLGVARDTVSRWIKRYRAHGLAGLYDKPKGHYPAKLTEDHLKRIALWLETGKDEAGNFVHWTRPQLRAEIERCFGVSLGVTAVGRYIETLGFRLKVPRPAHTKADPAAQASFKKKQARKSPIS